MALLGLLDEVKAAFSSIHIDTASGIVVEDPHADPRRVR